MSEDGTLCSYKLDFDGFKSASKGEIPTDYIYPELK